MSNDTTSSVSILEGPTRLLRRLRRAGWWLRIALSIAWRTWLFNLILTALLLGQQQPGTLASQSRASQLPVSGRTAQSSGSVDTQQTTAQGQGASVVQPSIQVSGALSGSIQGPELPPGQVKISLSEAVKRGLQVNLGSITADSYSKTARAQRAQALSQILPQISADLGATETQVSLATFGLTDVKGLSGIPTVVGPFHYVQAEGVLNWNALDLTQIRNYQSSKELERAARFDLGNARDLIVLAVGGTYLQVIADLAGLIHSGLR